MNLKRNLSRNTALAVSGGVLTLGAALGVASFAQAETPSPSPTASAGGSASPTDRPSGPGGRLRGHLNADAKALAEKLGLTEEVVSAALEKLRAARPAERPADPAAARAAFVTALAKELGGEEAKLTTALDELRVAHEAEHKQAFADRLAQALKDGKLTQAEADAVQKAADAGVIGYGGVR